MGGICFDGGVFKKYHWIGGAALPMPPLWETLSMVSLTPDSELYNFITSWEMIAAPQSFVQGSFSIKSWKLWYKNKGEFFTSAPL